MLDVCRTVEKIAPTDITTLLLGASGTGKERFAKAMHELSPRASQRLVAINCAAIPDTLLESELFGSMKGAFVAALLIGLIDTLGRAFLDDIFTLFMSSSAAENSAPAISAMLIYIIMAVVLAFRPFLP